MIHYILNYEGGKSIDFHALTPGRYVGAADIEDDDMPFAERFAALQARLEEQFEEAEKLTATIRARLLGVGANV
jgi:type I restriction enzyme M protein